MAWHTKGKHLSAAHKAAISASLRKNRPAGVKNLNPLNKARATIARVAKERKRVRSSIKATVGGASVSSYSRAAEVKATRKLNRLKKTPALRAKIKQRGVSHKVIS